MCQTFPVVGSLKGSVGREHGLLVDEGGYRADPGGVAVEAGDHGEVLATGAEETLAAADVDLFQGFQAVGGERGDQHGQALDTLGGQFLEDVVGIWPDPGRAAESALETDAVAVLAQAQALRQGAGCGEALGAVTVAVAGDDARAAIALGQAVGTAGVGFRDLALRQAVEAHEEVVVAAQVAQVLARDRLLGVEEGGVVVKRWHDRQVGHVPARAAQTVELLEAAAGGAGGVLGVERYDDQALDVVSLEGVERGGHGGVLVAHGEADHALGAHERLQLLGQRAGVDQQRRSLGAPDFAVSLGGFGRPEGQDDQVQQRPTTQRGYVDHAGVGEKLTQVAAHGRDGGIVRGAQVEQQDSGLGHESLRGGEAWWAPPALHAGREETPVRQQVRQLYRGLGESYPGNMD